MNEICLKLNSEKHCKKFYPKIIRARSFLDEIKNQSYTEKSVKNGFQYSQHPWISMVAMVFITIVLLIVGSNLGLGDFTFVFMTFVLYFVLVPLYFRIPYGKRSYFEYLSDIRLSRVKPLARILALVISSWIILAICQATGTILYRVVEGKSLSFSWIMSNVFDLTHDLPPKSNEIFRSMPSMLEEIGWRGVMLPLFMLHYSKRKSIAITSFGFGMMHIMNLSMGRELVWVLAQVGWSTIIGIFYAYSVLKTDSLWPAMLVHWLGNAFVYSLTRYVQIYAPQETWLAFNFFFSFGVLPTVLMILWVRYFIAKWPSDRAVETE